MESEAQAQSQSPAPAPTPPSNAGIQFMAWVEVNKKRLAYGAIGVALLIVVVAIFVQQQAGRETAASQALSDVRMPAHPGLPAEPGTADKLLKVANDYKGSKAAGQALVRSAGVLYTEGDFVKAQERFNALIEEYPDSLWVADAHFGVAASLQAQGKTEDAIKKFEDLRKRYASAPIADDVKLSLGRLYQASNSAEAFRLFDELMKGGNPNSPTAAEAAILLDNLLKAKPELAKLREPVVPPAPQPPVQITSITNRPAPGTNRTISLNNLIRSTNTAGTNKPVQIQLNPAPAPAAGSVQPAPPVAPVPSPGK